ncbi:hypothetical protein HK097_006973 [Rhizophlyctis rosea]|uniref:Beta-lactamase-related domain-containing protein n=1 Tax=Rhizophlyctis rosea TaxID=64517 RepID=A0AAD5SDQ8_9FUNG|nr:hypothetical protein HK097_006973 [Rhizophlyctis rosea]
MRLLPATLILTSLTATLASPAYTRPSGTDRNLQADLRSTIERVRKEWDVPGLSVTVLRGDKILFQEGFGVKNDKGEKVTPKTNFMIGSLSKAFTALGVANVISNDLTTWTTPISQISPFGFQDPIANQYANFIDLLSHRTGLPRHDAYSIFRESTQDSLKYIKNLEPNAQFREKFQYNNWMVTLGGTIAGNLSESKDWYKHTQNTVLNPLGMTSTFLSVKDYNATKDHSLSFITINGTRQVSPRAWLMYYAADNVTPAGGVSSNQIDLTKWAKFWLRGIAESRNVPTWNTTGLDQWVKITKGGKNVVKVKDLQTVVQPHTSWGTQPDFPEEGVTSAGIGWFLNSYRGKNFIQHGGDIADFTAHLTLVPDDNLAIIVLSNSGNLTPFFIDKYVIDRLFKFDPINWSVRYKKWEADRALASPGLPTPSAFTPPTLPLQSYLGTYNNPAYGNVTITTLATTNPNTSTTPVPLFEIQLGVSPAIKPYLKKPLLQFAGDTLLLPLEPLTSNTVVAFVKRGDGVAAVSVILEPALPKGIVFVRVA